MTIDLTTPVGRRALLWDMALLAVIAVGFTWPIMVHPDYWGIQDWDAFLARSGITRLTILDFGQLPLWNPYSNGGTPHLAHPEVGIFSVQTVLELLLGVVVGDKVSIILHLFVGLAGGYCLGRHLRLGRPAALLTALLFMLSSMYALTLTEGMIAGYSLGLMPWAWLFFLRAVDNNRALLATICCLTVMWLAGGIYPFCLSLLFFGTYLGCALLCREVTLKRAVSLLLLLGLGTLLLGAVKFLPAIEFTRQYPRHSDLYSGFSVDALIYGLVGRDQRITAIADKSEAEGFLHGFSHGMDEVGMYIGVLPLALFLLGVCRLRGRHYRPLALCLLIFLWLALGSRSAPFSLWQLVHQVPPYSILRTAERFRYVFMLCVAVFAGLGLQGVAELLHERLRLGRQGAARWALAVVGVILIDLCWVNMPVWRDAFPIPPLELPPTGAFMQISGWPGYDEHGPETPESNPYHLTYGAGYPALLANRGTLLAYESMPLPTRALAISDPGYRGEVYLDGTAGEAAYQEWSPNRLLVDVRAAGEGMVVINQNYYPGWRAGDGRQVEEVAGCLAVRVGPGVRQVELSYRPLSFVVGAMVSVVTLVVMVGCWWRLGRRGGGPGAGDE
jgi:hypothetical protein